MSRPIWMGLLTTAATLAALAPAAEGRHSQTRCYWASGILPNNELVSVRVEHPRMLEQCEGTRVTVRVLDRPAYAIAFGMDSRPHSETEQAPHESRRSERAGDRKRRPCKKRSSGAAKKRAKQACKNRSQKRKRRR